MKNEPYQITYLCSDVILTFIQFNALPFPTLQTTFFLTCIKLQSHFHNPHIHRQYTSMSTPPPTRLETELDLLHAMYPTQTSYSPTSRELKFTSSSTPEKATLLLRLPDTYPDADGLPDVISATDSSRNDVRNDVVRAVRELHLQSGEECLDVIISAFEDIVTKYKPTSESEGVKHASTSNHKENKNTKETQSQSKTVIIWLHHLLNTNKRKLCLTPPSAQICGLSKPGYPGVLIFSGPAPFVDEHVAVLKAQNWAAFQVRYEEVGVVWRFGHGRGVREVESMSEVVGGVECEGEQREVLLKAVGIK